MRRLAAQVPEQVSRLLKSTLIPTPPVWYQPVLANPPPILPSRNSRARPKIDRSGSPMRNYDPENVSKKLHVKPQNIGYEEDRVRRQFFKDFPFEALRPVSLVEGREIRSEHEIRGASWTALEQRGSFPSVEDVIAFCLNLKTYHSRPISQAYREATDEFVSLRARHEMATMAAEIEARHHGANFKPDAFERTHQRGTAALDTNSPSTKIHRQAAQTIKYKKVIRRLWKTSVPETAMPATEYTMGREYVERWRRPVPVDVGVTAEAGGKVLAAIEGVTKETAEGQTEGEAQGGGEEEVDDLDFLQRALERTKARAG